MITDQPSPSQYEDVDYETEHAQRQKRLVFSDPVHSISLKDTLQSQVRTTRINSELFGTVAPRPKSFSKLLVDHAARYSW